MLSLRNGCDPPVSWLPHTVLRAEPRAACTVVQLARSSKKYVIAFPFQSDRRAVQVCCVQCPIFVQVCPSHQLGDSCCVHAAGRAACEIKYKFSHHFSSFFNHTVWLSNRTKIPLESGSSADKRFRTDLKIFNKNCIIYVSQADVQSSKRSRVDLEPSLFFVSSPPSRKSSTNQKHAPISCDGDISNIRAPAHGP